MTSTPLLPQRARLDAAVRAGVERPTAFEYRFRQPSQNAMTTSLEQRLINVRVRLVAAHQQFITDVGLAVLDASIEALERAFAEARPAQPRLASTPRGDASATADTAFAPATAATAISATAAERVLARIREAPGSHVAQLSQSLRIHASTVRRLVRQLAAENAIRIEGTHDPRFGGQRKFFPREPYSVGTEPSSVGTEVSTGIVEASA